nr:hypothetical protein [Tanacetum cinerariifolium]
WVDPPTLLLS